MAVKIQLSPTQHLALTLLDDPTVVNLLFGGGAGGAKSMLVCIWMVLQCRNYAGVRIGLARQELVRLEETTLVTLFSKVHPILAVHDSDFEYNSMKHNITYRNGSQIHGVGLSYEPRDPDYDRFGSAEYTHTVIEEVGECSKKGVDVFTSRKNRFLNKEYGIVGKTAMTCNPTNNFIRQEYYEPYKALGMGRTQKWRSGNVHLSDGRMVPAYSAFIRSLVSDNPFADPNYIEELRRKPPVERKRLLEGDWDYTSTDYMLFTDLILDRASVGELRAGEMFIGVDLADGGQDSTVITLLEAGVIVHQEEIAIDRSSDIDPGEQNALGIIKYAQQHGFKSKDANRIAIDGVGIGTATRGSLRAKGWYVEIFIGGAAPETDGFANLRDEQYYQLSLDLQSGEIKTYSLLPTKTELRQELKPLEYENTGKVIKVTPKKKVKETIGRSPDRADSAAIARWVARKGNSNKASDHILL
jgi:phage terminase large subunit